jgi:ASPM-SPD-2-Hydin domain-containing protein
MARKPSAERISPSAWVLCTFAASMIAMTACGGDDGSLKAVRPYMVLEPDPGTSLSYPEIVITRGDDDPHIVVVRNIGEGTLVLERVVVTGDAADAFTISSKPTVVPPGAKGEIYVRFTPGGKIGANATLHIESNDRHLPTADYPLLGNARNPCRLEMVPPNTTFFVGETKSVVISALGDQDCKIVYVFTDEHLFPLVDPPDVPFVIPAGTSRALTVKHAARSTEPGTPIRSLTVKESEGTEATVSFEGEPPLFDCLSIFPLRIDFDTMPVGSMEQRNVTITNTCMRDAYVVAAEATIGYYYYSVDAAQFPMRIPAGASQDIAIDYSPFNRGGDDGAITFLTNDTGNPSLKVVLYGRASVPVVAIFPSVLDFGAVAYKTLGSPGTRSQCSSAAQYVQVYSAGDAPLTVSSLHFEGDADFEVTDVIVDGRPVANVRMPFSIPPSKDAKIYVQFYPTRLTPSDHQGALVIEHDADNSPFRVTLKGHAVGDGAATDMFQQLAGPKVDILFAIDDSCSMANKQALLIENLSHFVGYADAQGADYNIAVVDTEGFAPDSGMFQRDQCHQFPRVIGSHWADSMTRSDAFRCIFSLGTAGSGIEAGLAAAKNALIKAQDPSMDPDGLNQGFLRNDARLVIVAVSDADDQSREALPLQRDYFWSIKGPHRHGDVTVHAIAGPVLDPCPAGANQVEGPGYDYFWMTQQTGGQFFNICDRDWSPILTNLGLNVFQPINEWDLSQQADPGTLVVSVNGIQVPPNPMSGYTFNASSNSVKFNGASVPPSGATVTVSYSGLCRP